MSKWGYFTCTGEKSVDFPYYLTDALRISVVCARNTPFSGEIYGDLRTDIVVAYKSCEYFFYFAIKLMLFMIESTNFRTILI